MEIQNLHHNTLKIESFIAVPEEAWCFLGDNNSGIDEFMALLAGDLKDFSTSRLTLPINPGIISFDRQQLLFEEELRRDDSDFLDKIDPGTPVKEFLTDYRKHRELIRSFDMEHVLNTGYRQLSSGLLCRTKSGLSLKPASEKPYILRKSGCAKSRMLML